MGNAGEITASSAPTRPALHRPQQHCGNLRFALCKAARIARRHVERDIDRPATAGHAQPSVGSAGQRHHCLRPRFPRQSEPTGQRKVARRRDHPALGEGCHGAERRIGSGKQVWVISGDLSFQYDGNALWNGFVPKDLRIIIINNSGGGIFRLIDGPSSVPELAERFETQTQSSAQHKAAQHGLDYFACTDERQIDSIWQDFAELSGSAKILEIFTDPAANEAIFKTFQKQLSNTI